MSNKIVSDQVSRKRLLLVLCSIVLSLTVTLPFAQQTGLAQGAPRYQVTITNLTRGQAFTPPVVASHVAGVKIFTLGEPASEALEVLAEAGDTGPLATMLSSNQGVGEVVAGSSPIPPGQSASFTVTARGQFDHISVASMLVPTNDGFFALNGVEASKNPRETVEFFSPAYDAGTEPNDELCVNIPGPPGVCMGEGFNPSRAGAEGYVHIHAGIHGIGDLNPADRDWRNPVALIRVTRLR